MDKKILEKLKRIVNEGLDSIDPAALSATQIKDLARLLESNEEKEEIRERPFEDLDTKELEKLAGYEN